MIQRVSPAAAEPAAHADTGLATQLRLRVPSGEEIARCAYEFYEQRGRQHGRDRDDWLTAERELHQRALRELLDTILVTGGPHVIS